MVILDGNKLSKEILENIAEEIRAKNFQLKLAIILVGNNLVSDSYINKKQEACAAVGIDFELFKFSSKIDEGDLKKEVKKIVKDKNVSGIVIQLPLPQKFNTSAILDLISPEKDADVLSSVSFDKFSKNNLPILPPVVGAVKYLLEQYKIPIADKKIVLIGKGKLVGKPLSVWLKNNKMKFSLLDKGINNISDFTEKADIIISGAGCPGLIKENILKDGVVLIDVGTTSEEGRIKGDVDQAAYQKASYVAPVPGGVGPVTIACLIDNLLKLHSLT